MELVFRYASVSTLQYLICYHLSKEKLTFRLPSYFRFTPVGVASLLARTIASSKDTSGEFKQLGMYLVTVILGLLIWSLIVVPVVYFVIRRCNPFRFLLTLMEAVLIVFATSST